MKRFTALLLVVLFIPAGVLNAAISETWGGKGFIQRSGTVSYEQIDGQTAIVFDLSTLPEKTEIYRARLFVRGRGDGFHFFQADGSGKVIGDQIKLSEPYRRWFDATRAVQTWRKQGSGKLIILCKTDYDSRQTRAELEIMFEGKPKAPPRQVTGIKLMPFPGQVLVAFKEIEDIAGGNDNITWGQMKDTIQACSPYGMILKNKKKELIYRVYRHDKPITSANIGEAELLNELYPGSLYTDPSIPKNHVGEHGPTYLLKGDVLKRLYVGHDKQLSSGTGTYMHTYAKSGKGFYAVTTCINGVENTTDFSDGNTCGPLEEKEETPAPMFYSQQVTKLGKPAGAEPQERWYQWWVQMPLSHMPRRVDVVVYICPQTLEENPALVFYRGAAWNTAPGLIGNKVARKNIVISDSSDSPNVFWMGLNDGNGNLKGQRDGRWQPFPMRRRKALIDWAAKMWKIDRNRITAETGCWGMMEIEDGHIYASCSGWGLPEVTKGFQGWSRAGIWGGPALYKDRPKEENPYYRQDYGNWIRLDPKRETPWWAFNRSRGAHDTEMGWPPFPRFLRGMIDTKRAFVFNSTHVLSVMGPKIRLNQTLPAFGNCSLDGNLGNGDLANGDTFGSQLNGYLLWDTESIVDEKDKWEMTVWLTEGDNRGTGAAPLPECTVDITPRRCQAFKSMPGQTFKWTNTDLTTQEVVAQGVVTADKWGLVTVEQALVTKGKNRIALAK